MSHKLDRKTGVPDFCKPLRRDSPAISIQVLKKQPKHQHLAEAATPRRSGQAWECQRSLPVAVNGDALVASIVLVPSARTLGRR